MPEQLQALKAQQTPPRPPTPPAAKSNAKWEVEVRGGLLTGYNPSGGDGLNSLVNPPATAQAGHYRPGGYIKNLPKDPWGRPYQLAVPGKKGPFDIYSLGADGAPGGADENADIYGGEG